MPSVSELRVKLFADGADLRVIETMAANPQIKGFTTNPTLMRKAGVADYEAFARAALAIVPDRPISFEVFSDDFEEMAAQAAAIASWGAHVFVKIPVTNTKGEFAGPLIAELTAAGVQVNVTAVLTLEQVERVAGCLRPGVASFVSVFAGRIADTGRDPVALMAAAVEMLRTAPGAELIWASPRELLNVVQGAQIGCHVITVTHDILRKLPILGRDLEQYSLDTVEMFWRDAVSSGLSV